MDCIGDGFQFLLGCTAYWWVHNIEYWQGLNVKCGRHGMALSVTEVQSHDEGRVEESVSGVHGSVWFHGLQQCIGFVGNGNVATN